MGFETSITWPVIFMSILTAILTIKVG